VTVTLWSKTAVKGRSYPQLEAPQFCDVCVVGGGVGGVATSYFLAKGGAKVVLLEAERISAGAVGKSSGFANAGLWVPPSDIMKAVGEVYGPRLIDILGAAPQATFDLIERLGLDCDADHAGTLQCAPDDAAFRDLRERLAAANRPETEMRLADRQETARLTGSTAFKGALIDYRAGVLQPVSYVRELARVAADVGASIFENEQAIGFHRTSGRWIITTKTGSVSATWLILATEARTIGNLFGLAGEYVPMPYFNAATRPLTDLEKASVMPAGQPIVDLRKVVSSYRFDASGRLIVGSIGEVAGPDGLVNRRWISRKIARLFPALRGIKVEHAWAGIIGVTENHMPTVHRLGDNAYSLGGYNGRGIAAGTVLGETLSQVVLGKRRDVDLPVPVTEPTKASLAALRGIGLRAGAAAFHMIDGRVN
jgi:glycine/D-amino acid oxidase-like deaminating enzyme